MQPPKRSGDGVQSAFLLLVDGRIPSGSYAHSGGVEAAIGEGRVSDLHSLAAYLLGRLHTTGVNDACLAIAAHEGRDTPELLDVEAAARCISPALRTASRAEGRGLLRAARAMWPSTELDELADTCGSRGPMWPIALGFAARVAGLDARHAALGAAQAAISGAAWAAVRLLGLDPYQVTALLASLTGEVDRVTEDALRITAETAEPRDLPARAAPLHEIGAEEREKWEVRLFVS
jgi:urease accessory protein